MGLRIKLTVTVLFSGLVLVVLFYCDQSSATNNKISLQYSIPLSQCKCKINKRRDIYVLLHLHRCVCMACMICTSFQFYEIGINGRQKFTSLNIRQNVVTALAEVVERNSEDQA